MNFIYYHLIVNNRMDSVIKELLSDIFKVDSFYCLFINTVNVSGEEFHKEFTGHKFQDINFKKLKRCNQKINCCLLHSLHQDRGICVFQRMRKMRQRSCGMISRETVCKVLF